MGSGVLLLPLAALMFPPPRCFNCAAFLRVVLLPSALCAVLTFGGGILFTFGLQGTTVGVSTALTRTKPIFIYFLSLVLRILTFNARALLASLLAVAGVAVLLIVDVLNNSPHQVDQSWWGIVLNVAASFVWAGTDIYLQHTVTTRFTQSSSLVVQMFAFQGAIAAWDLMLCWPVPLIAALEMEGPFEFPSMSALPTIAAACVALVSTNLSVGVGIACSSAFFMGIGSLVAVPVAFVVDYCLHDTVPSISGIIGASLVIMSFLIMMTRSPESDVSTNEASSSLECDVAYDVAGYDVSNACEAMPKARITCDCPQRVNEPFLHGGVTSNNDDH